MNWIFGGLFLVAIAILIYISDLIRRKLNGKAEVTRKIVHIVTGLLMTATPFIFDSNYPILIIALIFIPVDYLAVKRGLFEAMHGTDRRSYGTVFYPIAFFVLTYLLWDHYKAVLVTSILILALADALAAIVGGNIKMPIRYTFGSESKSIQGSATMFIVTFILVVTGLRFLSDLDSFDVSLSVILWIAALTALVATACESVSFKGSDNITVPLGAAFTMHFMITHPVDNPAFTSGLIMALILAVVSYRLKFLDGGGAVTTFLLGVVVFGIGGWKFALPMLLFFVLSSLISKLGKKKKRQLSEKFQKSSQRDLWQVLANGGVAGLMVIIWNYYPYDIWYYLFLTSVAAANADTWGTEIGVFARMKPRHILKLKPVPVGSSGGITPLGTLGAFVGSAVIAVTSLLYGHGLLIFFYILMAGFIGSIVDSIIGATIQAQYQCPKCQKVTEKLIHCNDQKTAQISGWNWVDNDVVNGLCTLSGAAIVWIELSIL